MKIVVVGYDQMFSNLVLGVLASGHRVVGVFRHEKVVYNPFLLFFKDIFAPSKDYSFIKSLNLNEIDARSVNSKQFKKELLKLEPDLIIVGSWSEKFKKPIIDLPKIGTINCHPSILPKYRGPNPYIRVIMNGEKETGITFHLMDENLDTGPILMQKKLEILQGFDGDTGGTLKNKCCNLAKPAVCELLQSMDNEIIIPIAQNPKEATYYPQISEKDILLDFRKSSVELDRKLRALSPFQPAYLPHGKTFLKVKSHKIFENKTKFTTPGTIVRKEKNNILVVTGDNKLIALKGLQVFGPLGFLTTPLYVKMFVKIGDICR